MKEIVTGEVVKISEELVKLGSKRTHKVNASGSLRTILSCVNGNPLRLVNDNHVDNN